MFHFFPQIIRRILYPTAFPLLAFNTVDRLLAADVQNAANAESDDDVSFPDVPLVVKNIIYLSKHRITGVAVRIHVLVMLTFVERDVIADHESAVIFSDIECSAARHKEVEPVAVAVHFMNHFSHLHEFLQAFFRTAGKRRALQVYM